ncbi:sulfatase, partial [Halalkalibaculum sp. DA384]|uniref:sulfatase family protein n=1 Tax=Halalkalibaculum sp. DA384 TaxID=3373606 RepID=UPI0037540D88
PNIVFIMSDDHSYQTLSAYDDRFIETPHLDRIAGEGVTFVNSFVANSICAPSRATLLTGKHSHMNGQLDNRRAFDGRQQTFPKLLQGAGYQTALVGKWHLRSTPTGYDHYERLIGQGDYYNSDFITNGDTARSHGYVTDVITDKSIRWLENRTPGQPFALQVHHKASHRIWMPDTSALGAFQDAGLPVPDTFFDDFTGKRYLKTEMGEQPQRIPMRIPAAETRMSIATEDMDLVYDLKLLDEEGEIQTKYREMYANDRYARLDEQQKAAWDAHYDPIIREFKQNWEAMSERERAIWKYRRYMRDYLATIRTLDENVGRLLEYLKAEGLYENTLVVYTSDQGFYMGEHGWFDKRFIYEQSMRTPLLMKFPEGMATREEVDELVQNIDWAPTLLELAGVEVPAGMQGQSLLPLVQNEDDQWRDALYYHYYEFPNEHMVKKHYGLRTDRYKLIHFYDDIEVWELYDLQEDPMELNNLYGQPEYAQRTRELKERLR